MSTKAALKVRKGTPLEALEGQLSLVSYNLLAPLYVRPVDSRTGEIQSFAAFAWAPDEVRVLLRLLSLYHVPACGQ